jgi:hypothetical protein
MKYPLPGVVLAGPTTEDTHRSGFPEVATALTTESRKSSAGPGVPREHPAATALAISRDTHHPCRRVALMNVLPGGGTPYKDEIHRGAALIRWDRTLSHPSLEIQLKYLSAT